MRRLISRRWSPVPIAMLISFAACGKSMEPGSPSSPSGFGTPTPPAGSISGATIAGTVISGVGASSLRPMGISMTVSIVGTSMSATVDSAGHFTLRNAPSGDLTLAFKSNGVDARVTLLGVRANDQLRIAVRVNGNVAELDENEHEMANNEAEVEGRVASTSCAANPPTIVVGTMTPTTVNIQNARIHHGGTTLTCAQIQINDRVEAHGTRSGTTIVATELNVQTEHGVQPPGEDHGHDGDDQNGEGEVKGTVVGAAVGHVCPGFTFTVGSTNVTTNAATKFEDTACAGVVNGIRVEVKGIRTSANAITARKVERK